MLLALTWQLAAAHAETQAVRLLYTRGEGAAGCPDEQTVGKGTLPMIDMGYDAEITDVFHGGGKGTAKP